jgi:hypothetical protein
MQSPSMDLDFRQIDKSFRVDNEARLERSSAQPGITDDQNAKNQHRVVLFINKHNETNKKINK